MPVLGDGVRAVRNCDGLKSTEGVGSASRENIGEVMTNRIILIGCSKTKKAVDFDPRTGGRVIPEQLYGSQLFSKRVDYANARGLRWAVLSARYSVWFPHIGLKAYDQTFSDMIPADIAAWHVGVAQRLMEELWEQYNLGQSVNPIKPSELTIEIHAGADYCHPLTEILRAVGIAVELPLAGLGIGEQLAWYCSAKPEAKVRTKFHSRRKTNVTEQTVDGGAAGNQLGQEDRTGSVVGGKAGRDLFWSGADREDEGGTREDVCLLGSVG